MGNVGNTSLNKSHILGQPGQIDVIRVIRKFDSMIVLVPGCLRRKVDLQLVYSHISLTTVCWLQHEMRISVLVIVYPEAYTYTVLNMELFNTARHE